MIEEVCSNHWQTNDYPQDFCLRKVGIFEYARVIPNVPTEGPVKTSKRPVDGEPRYTRISECTHR